MILMAAVQGAQVQICLTCSQAALLLVASLETEQHIFVLHDALECVWGRQPLGPFKKMSDSTQAGCSVIQF